MSSYYYKQLRQKEKDHWLAQNKRALIKQLAKAYALKRKNNNILVMGLHSGLLLDTLKKLGTITGFDEREEVIAFNKEHFDGNLVLGKLPWHVNLPENSFDIIVMNDILQYVEQDAWALEKAKGLLKEEGILIVSVPAYEFLKNKEEENDLVIRHYTSSELQLRLDQAGLYIEKQSYYNFFLFPFVALNRFLDKLTNEDDDDFSLPGFLDNLLNKLLGCILRSERFLLNFMNLPFGTELFAVATKGAVQEASQKKEELPENFEEWPKQEQYIYQVKMFLKKQCQKAIKRLTRNKIKKRRKKGQAKKKAR